MLTASDTTGKLDLLKRVYDDERDRIMNSLEGEYQDKINRLANLERQRDELEVQMKTIESEIDALLNVGSDNVQPSKANSQTAKVKSKKGASLNDRPMSERVLSLLNQYRREMHVNEIANILLARGFKTVSKIKILRASIASVLLKDGRFVKTKPNTFYLSVPLSKNAE